MVTKHPFWSDNQTFLAPVALTSGNQASAIIDLRGKVGAFVLFGVAKGGSVQPSTAINVVLTRQINAGGQILGGRSLAPILEVDANRTSTIISTLCSGNTSSGTATMKTKALGALTAGAMMGIAPDNLTRFEVAKTTHKRPVATASALTFTNTLMYQHSGTQDKAFNCAQEWPAMLAGGAVHRLVFRHPGASGSKQIVWAIGQVYYGDGES